MKIVAMIQAYNELSQGNLRRCLDSVSSYCDDIVIYDDGSTDGSDKVYPEYTSHIIWGKQNDFRNELSHKQLQLDYCKNIGADWIWRIDADEVIEKRGEDGALREHCETTQYDSWAFHMLNLWRHPYYARLDSSYNDVIFNRLWRVPPEGLKFNIQRGLHLTNYPLGVTKNEGFSDLEILHFGFASDNAIVYKYMMYKAHGQSGANLDRLVNERGLRVRKVPVELFGKSVGHIDDKSMGDIFSVPIVNKVQLYEKTNL